MLNNVRQPLILFLMFIVCIIGCGCTVNTPSEGEKIGRIVKLSREGFFCKTWEGELIRGGITDGSGSMGISFHFTVEADSARGQILLNLLHEAMQSQSEVILSYRSEAIVSVCRSESTHPYFITNIIAHTH